MGNICVYNRHPIKLDHKSKFDKVTEELVDYRRSTSIFKEDAILITKFNALLSLISDLEKIIEKFKTKLQNEINELVEQNIIDLARSKTVYLIVCDHITKDILTRKLKLEELKTKLEEDIAPSLPEENLQNVNDIDWTKNTFKRSKTTDSGKEEERLNQISTCNKAYFRESSHLEQKNTEIISMIKGYNYLKRKSDDRSSRLSNSIFKMENSRSNTSKSYQKTMVKSSEFSARSTIKKSLANEPANKKSLPPVGVQNKKSLKNISQVKTDIKNSYVSDISNHQKQSLNVDFLNNRQDSKNFREDSKNLSYFLDDGNKNSCSMFLEKFQGNSQNMQSVTEMESFSPQKYRGSRNLSSIDLNSIRETKIQSGVFAKNELPDPKIIKTGQSSMQNSYQNNTKKPDDTKDLMLNKVYPLMRLSSEPKKVSDIGEPVDNTKFPRVIFEKYDVSDDDILMKLSEISSLKLNA